MNILYKESISDVVIVNHLIYHYSPSSEITSLYLLYMNETTKSKIPIETKTMVLGTVFKLVKS